jgi:hypothetical protein
MTFAAAVVSFGMTTVSADICVSLDGGLTFDIF